VPRTADALMSIVIPAHNEARGIAHTLEVLQGGTKPGELEIVVACNGCTDDTAARARRAAPRATVLELVEPSKHQAQGAGGAVARAFPRILMDADVLITGTDLEKLSAALVGEIQAAAPRRRVASSGSRVIDAYYRVWQQLPQVRAGLFGRGVIALSAAGWQTINDLPPMMSDDLVVSEAFPAHVRRIVEDAIVEIKPPRRVRDLVKRRIRVVTGNAQADQHGLRGSSSVTEVSDLLALCRRQPSRVPDVAVFVAITVVARLGAKRAVRRNDFQTWLRDESSRE